VFFSVFDEVIILEGLSSVEVHNGVGKMLGQELWFSFGLLQGVDAVVVNSGHVIGDMTVCWECMVGYWSVGVVGLGCTLGVGAGDSHPWRGREELGTLGEHWLVVRELWMGCVECGVSLMAPSEILANWHNVELLGP
jgi:hypothetical protein